MDCQERLNQQLLKELVEMYEDGDDEHNNFPAITALIEAGADPNVTDDEGHNALHILSFYNYPDELLQAILRKIADINAVENTGRTALMLAASNDNSDMVIALMGHLGIDPNIQDKDFKYTALHWAVSAEDLSHIVALLLHFNGIDVNLKDKKGRTPLDLARELEHSRSVQILENQESKPALKRQKTGGSYFKF